MENDSLHNGIAAAKAGEYARAQGLLAKAVIANPKSEEAWLWLGIVLTEPERREFCFRRVLALNPDNAEAKERLKGKPPPKPGLPVAATKPPSVPEPMRPTSNVDSTLRSTPRPIIGNTETAKPAGHQERAPGLTPSAIAPQSASAPTHPEPTTTVPPIVSDTRQPDLSTRPAPAYFAKTSDDAPSGIEKILVAILGLVLGLIVCGGLPYFLIQTGRLDPALRIAATTPISPLELSTPSPTPVPSSAPIPAATNTLVVRPSTPAPPSTLTASQATKQFQTLYLEARYAEAIALLDPVIAAGSNDSEVYYGRARAYQQLMQNQRMLEEYQAYNQRALADLDKAIMLDPTIGAYYYSRGDVYSSWAGIETYRVDRDALLQVALENYRMAMAYGNTIDFSDVSAPLVLSELGRCDESLAETQRLIKPTESGLNTLLAMGNLCSGKLDLALPQIETAIRLNPNTTRKYDRAIILYNMGRLNDALTQLNELIDAEPDYSGDRYYFRALIYYDMKKPDLANADLATGSANTWGRGGLLPYVQGRLLIDAGDKARGTELIRVAEATLGHEYGPLLDRIRKEVVQLGAAPLAPTPSIQVAATPISTPQFTPTKPAVEVPQDAPRVDLAVGTGKLTLAPSTDQAITQYQPSTPILYKTVQSLTFRLTSGNASGPTPLQLYVSNLTDGGWGIVNLRWGDNEIVRPEKYVGPHGEIYAAIRSQASEPITIDNAGFKLTIVKVDGSTAAYGLK